MALKSRAKLEKPQKEQARQDRQEVKRERRAAARERKAHEVPAGEAPEVPDNQAGTGLAADEAYSR